MLYFKLAALNRECRVKSVESARVYGDAHYLLFSTPKVWDTTWIEATLSAVLGFDATYSLSAFLRRHGRAGLRGWYAL
jgi:hypothetical protein